MTCSSNLTTRQWQQITHNDSGVMSGSSRGSTDLGLLKAGLAAVGLAAILPKAGGPASAATAASALGGSAGHHHHRGRRYRVPAVTAALGSLSGLVIDRAGNPVVTDFGDNVGRVVPARSGRFYGKAMRAGNIYIVAGNGHRRFTGDGGPAFAAGLGPQGVAVDAAGNLVTPTREQPGWGGGRRATGTFYGQAMMAGQIYTVAATASQAARVTAGRPPWPSCRVPAGVAVTGSGGLLIADADNFRVRLVAETSGTFYGQKMTTGTSTRRAGGGTEGISARACPVMAARPARRARGPGLGRDRRGGEPAAHRRRPGPAGRRRNGRFYGQAMTAAHIYTVAGMIEGGYSGDGGPADAAQLLSPESAVADAAGNLLVADDENGRIRIATGRCAISRR